MIRCWKYIKSFGHINIQVECFPRTRDDVRTQVQFLKFVLITNLMRNSFIL
jgi:hypothetical protein